MGVTNKLGASASAALRLASWSQGLASYAWLIAGGENKTLNIQEPWPSTSYDEKGAKKKTTNERVNVLNFNMDLN